MLKVGSNGPLKYKYWKLLETIASHLKRDYEGDRAYVGD